MYIREPFVAGRFYTRDRNELSQQISGYINKASDSAVGDICAIIAPHAGYIYSGEVAACAYRQLVGREFDTVIVMAPSHYERFDGISVIPEGLYRTPLGDMTIDAAFTRELMKSSDFTFIENAHIPEHSLEVQIPFVQSVLPDATLVPLVLSNSSLDLMKRCGEAISKSIGLLKRKALLVISTDLSHFHDYDDALARDKKFITTLESGDPQLLKKVLDQGFASACGEAPLLAGLYFAHARGSFKVRILKYANSGDTSGERSRVVGYMAGAIELLQG